VTALWKIHVSKCRATAIYDLYPSGVNCTLRKPLTVYFLCADQKCGDQPVCGQHGKEGEREGWLFQLSRHGWKSGERKTVSSLHEKVWTSLPNVSVSVNNCVECELILKWHEGKVEALCSILEARLVSYLEKKGTSCECLGASGKPFKGRRPFISMLWFVHTPYWERWGDAVEGEVMNNRQPLGLL